MSNVQKLFMHWHSLRYKGIYIQVYIAVKLPIVKILTTKSDLYALNLHVYCNTLNTVSQNENLNLLVRTKFSWSWAGAHCEDCKRKKKKN